MFEMTTEAALAGRYLVVDVLGSSACGGVYRAIDVGAYPPRACVLKEFWRDAGGDLYRGLAPDWGNNEAELLARHNGDPEFLNTSTASSWTAIFLSYWSI